MQLIELEQGSEAWLLYRLDHANASETPALLGVAPDWYQIKTPYQLYQLKNGEIEYEVSDYVAGMQEHGNNMEIAARRRMETQYHAELLTPTIEHIENDVKYGASLDGFGQVVIPASLDKDLPERQQTIKFEIKCPAKGESSARWKAAEKGEIVEHDYWQIVHQELVCPTDITIYVVFLDDDKFIEINLDEFKPNWREDIAAVKTAWEAFFKSPPEPDWKERRDKKWNTAAASFKAAKEAEKAAKAAVDNAKAVLIDLAGDEKKVRGQGVEVKLMPGKAGSIDYKKVPELKGVDLEKYRKAAGKPFWQMDIRE